MYKIGNPSFDAGTQIQMVLVMFGTFSMRELLLRTEVSFSLFEKLFTQIKPDAKCLRFHRSEQLLIVSQPNLREES